MSCLLFYKIDPFRIPLFFASLFVYFFIIVFLAQSKKKKINKCAATKKFIFHCHGIVTIVSLMPLGNKSSIQKSYYTYTPIFCGKVSE